MYGAVLRRWRKICELSQFELAGMLDVKQCQISHWEVCRQKPRKLWAREMREFFASLQDEDGEIKWDELDRRLKAAADEPTVTGQMSTTGGEDE